MKKRYQEGKSFVPFRWRGSISVLCCYFVVIVYHEVTFIRLVRRAEPITTDRAIGESNEDWPPTSILDTLIQQKKSTIDNPMHSKNRRLVVTATNSEYVDFADNFAQSLLSLDVHDFVIVPLDMDAYNKLSFAYPEHTLPLMPGTSHPTEAAAYLSTAFKELTSTRPKFLQAFLSKGYTILYNDIDMVWRHNLWDVIDERNMFIDANGKRTDAEAIMWMDGRQICTCNLYLVPTLSTVTLLQEWEAAIDSNRFKHDQDAFSDVIEHFGFSYNTEMKATEIQAMQFPIRASNKSFLIYNNDEQIPSAVNFTWDQPSQEDNVTVLIHNNWIVGKQKKQKRFQNAGLWHLSKKIPTTKDLISFGIRKYEEEVKATEGRSKYCATKRHRVPIKSSLRQLASDCLQKTKNTIKLDYPSDADMHFNELRMGLSHWAQHIYHTPHMEDQYGGPWIENHFIDYFESLYNNADGICLSSIFGPFIPIFLPWTDIWFSNGYKYPDQLFVDLKSVLRPNVPYITVYQNYNYMIRNNDMSVSSFPNIVVLSAAGYGHIPIPLLNQEEKCITDVLPVNQRRFDISFVWSLQNASSRMRSKMNEIIVRHNSSSFRYIYFNGNDWKSIVRISKFTVVLQSNGRSEYHLMKVLQMGFIPIYVYSNNDTAWVPYSDLFPQIGFATDMDGLNNLVLQLKSLSNEEIEKRERHIRSLREKFFTYKGVLQQIKAFVKGENNELRCQQRLE